MELPVVNHEDYFAKICDDHKFPINKFGELADYLIKNKIVKTPSVCLRYLWTIVTEGNSNDEIIIAYITLFW